MPEDTKLSVGSQVKFKSWKGTLTGVVIGFGGTSSQFLIVESDTKSSTTSGVWRILTYEVVEIDDVVPVDLI